MLITFKVKRAFNNFQEFFSMTLFNWHNRLRSELLCTYTYIYIYTCTCALVYDSFKDYTYAIYLEVMDLIQVTTH